MTDLFEEPKKKEFDNYGRYLLPSPHTGNQRPWTRVTTFAKVIMDTYALNLWQQRMTAKGMALRSDLVAMASTMDVSKDRERMNNLVSQAKDAAGYKVAANKGTAVHSFTEGLDSGELTVEDVPSDQRPDIMAYQECMRAKGLTVVPSLIERRICLPQYEVAGTFDRVLKEADGTSVIGDVKSGRDLSYNWLEIAIQLACYAHGINAAGVWDVKKESWTPTPKVRTDYAVVMHIPAGTGSCKLYRVDIQSGWEAAQLCAVVRDWRKRSGLAKIYDGPQPLPQNGSGDAVRAVHDARVLSDWQVRFGTVQSKEEAMALYQEARRTYPEGSSELASLVERGRKALGMSG